MPARFGLSQHGYDRECKRVITVPCRAGPARVYIRGLARYGTVVAASVNANRASNRAGERFSVIPCSHERVYRDEIDPIRNGSVSDRLLERCSHVQQRRRTEVNMIVVMWA